MCFSELHKHVSNLVFYAQSTITVNFSQATERSTKAFSANKKVGGGGVGVGRGIVRRSKQACFYLGLSRCSADLVGNGGGAGSGGGGSDWKKCLVWGAGGDVLGTDHVDVGLLRNPDKGGGGGGGEMCWELTT